MTEPTSETKVVTTNQEMDFGGDNTEIVGGEMILPTARLVGEDSDKPAKERGWLSAIVSANSKEGVSSEEKRTNIQAIVDEAKKHDVPVEKIKDTLEDLGIAIKYKQENP